MKKMGLKTLPDYALPMKEMISIAVKEAEADPEGYFIERFLAKIEEAENSSDVCSRDSYESLFLSLTLVFLKCYLSFNVSTVLFY